MSKRITCISLFDKESINKIEKLVEEFNGELCKVPCFEENRGEKDTLPYHITLQIWNEEQKEEALQTLKQIKLKPITLNVNNINIKKSYKDSYNLYLEIELNTELRNIYKQFYKITKNSKYNPEIFKPHITLHCDRDYNKIVEIKEKIEQSFTKFEIYFEEIGLFEIYPAKRIK